MAYANTTMGAGFPAGQAQALGGGVATGLTAAGTSIADAFDLGRLGINVVTTVASGAGVQIAVGGPGDSTMVYNAGANPLLVYPPTSTTRFNAIALGGALTLGVNTAVMLTCESPVRWIANLSA